MKYSKCWDYSLVLPKSLQQSLSVLNRIIREVILDLLLWWKVSLQSAFDQWIFLLPWPVYKLFIFLSMQFPNDSWKNLKGRLFWVYRWEISTAIIHCRFFVLHKLILQTLIWGHPVGLDVWFLVGPFVCFHTSCVQTAKSLARLGGCAGSPMW